MATKVPRHNANSMETILTFDNRDNLSDWSVEWSTTHIPGMHNAAGRGPARRVAGRRRLRLGSLALGSALVMHCRVAASALTGGFSLYPFKLSFDSFRTLGLKFSELQGNYWEPYFNTTGTVVFYLSLVVAVALLANPMRHFEVYLGQWSISGPGRAFRIVPMFDGIGLAICINCIVRAINFCTIAAMAVLYITHTTSDSPLPFKYCRDWNLNVYDPIIKNVTAIRLREGRFSLATAELKENATERPKVKRATVGLHHRAWRYPISSIEAASKGGPSYKTLKMCKESYPEGYPSLYKTPAYNYFYVEVTKLRPELGFKFDEINLPLLICNGCIWLVIWIIMISERVSHGRLIWNNVYSWCTAVPWVWASCLALAAAYQVSAPKKILLQVFKVGGKEIIAGISDALEVALYIHSASTGTEIIFGKGLNHFASGHIDPELNGENVWHSGLLLLLAGLHCCSAAVCALADLVQPDTSTYTDYNMHQSMLWIIPMYSKCTSVGKYSHAISTVIFAGLCFSYMLVAYVLLKTALHIIFEYRVKLVFVEQLVVAVLIISCMILSLPYSTFGGLPLLESVEAIMSGLGMPVLCALQLLALLVLYHSHDFVSDMNVATEENTCASRIGTQWQIIPFIVIVLIIAKIVALTGTELPAHALGAAVGPLAVLLLAVPLRACHNAYVFLRPAPRRGV